MRPRAPIVLLWGALVLPGLALRELMPPDEPRFALVARQMRETGRWIVPHLNGDVYPDKPPVLFWAINLVSWPFGAIGEVTARIPSALAALAVLLLTARLAARLAGGGYDGGPGNASGASSATGTAAGLAAAAVLLTTAEFFQKAQWVSTDMLLCALTLAAAVAWSEALFDSPGKPAGADEPANTTPDRRRLILGWLAAAGAVLTKGPVGLLWPLAWVFAEGIARHRPARALAVFGRGGFPGVAAFVAIAGGWLAAAEALTDTQFVRHVLVRESAERYLAAWNNQRPWHYYLHRFPADFVPWALFLPAAIAVAWKTRRERDAGLPARAGLVLLGFAVVFFSLSPGKRGVYLLPAFPFVAIAVAHAFVRVGDDDGTGRGWITRPLAILAIAGGLIAAVLGWAALADPGLAVRLTGHADTATGAGRISAAAAALAGAALLAGSLVALRRFHRSRRGRPAEAGAALGATVAGLVPSAIVAACVLAPAASGYQGAEAFGAEIARRVPPGASIALERGKAELVLFYAGRDGVVFEDTGDLAGGVASRVLDHAVVRRASLDAWRRKGMPADWSVAWDGRLREEAWVLLTRRPANSGPAGPESPSDLQ